MTNAQKMAFLKAYQTCEREAARTKEEIAFWRRRAGESAAAGDGGDAPARMRYYARMLQTRYRACLAARLLLEDAVATVPDPKQRLLLRLHYVDGLTLEAAAEQMEICPRHASRLHRQALEAVEAPELWPGKKQAAFEEALTRLCADAEWDCAA